MKCPRRRGSLVWLAVILITGLCLYGIQIQFAANHLSKPDLSVDDTNVQRIQYSYIGDTLTKGPVHRFVVGLNYWEQLNMALNNFFKLASLASLWNARTVRPFTSNSRLYGLNNYKPDENVDVLNEALGLDAIYDLRSMDAVVAGMGLPPLASFEEFLRYANRGLVVVHLVPEKAAHEIPVLAGALKAYLEGEFTQDNVVECRTQMRNFTKQLLSRLNQEATRVKVSNFTVDEYFCVNMSHPTTPQELATKFNIQDDGSSISVIVFNWRGNSGQSVLTASAKGKHQNNRLIMDMPIPPKTYSDLITHSNRVMTAANQYIKHLNLTADQYLVMHLRSEKMGLREPRFPGNAKKCLEAVLMLRDNILSQFPLLRNITITDYGPYSSDTCKKCKAGTTMKKLLYKAGLNPVYYDPVALGEVGDRGFAAAVEMEVMVSAKYLLLCGGGAFQNQAAMRFAREHDHRPSSQQDTLFMVCTDDAAVREVMND